MAVGIGTFIERRDWSRSLISAMSCSLSSPERRGTREAEGKRGKGVQTCSASAYVWSSVSPANPMNVFWRIRLQRKSSRRAMVAEETIRSLYTRKFEWREERREERGRGGKGKYLMISPNPGPPQPPVRLSMNSTAH